MRLRLKKRTSINSNQSQPLHKEKEMADFRKCLLAFALIALLSGLASAQVTPALQCTFNAAVTPTVRAEGLAELVGDIVLNCTGGQPTAVNAIVPQANVTVYLSTNMTSRITASPFTEVFMMFDEPHSPANITYTQSGTIATPGTVPMVAATGVSTPGAVPLYQCDQAGSLLGICSVYGTGNGLGTYDPRSGGNGALGVRPNVFQARVTGNNQVTFFGVPIDPPGTSGNRIIRITNLRGNANLLGVSSTLVPTQIVANISVSPPNLLPLNNPQQTVAFVAKGLTVSVRDGSMTAANVFIQCVSANSAIAADPTKGFPTTAGSQDLQQFGIRYDEGFPAAWKEKNIAVHLINTGVLAGGAISYATDSPQDVPGSNYFSESGFEVNGATIGAAPAGFGPFLTPNAAFVAATRGATLAGTANQGTRLMAQFNSIPTGTQLFVPVALYLVNQQATASRTGVAVLVQTDNNGAGAFSPVTGATATGLAPVSISGGSGIAVYEILYDDPFNNERLTVPVAVAYVSNAGNNLPAPNVQSTVTGSFAPLSNVGTYDSSNAAPIPRFAPSTTPLNTYKIVKCSCNVLFPWVVYSQGYDTGIALSNTSVDPWGTTPQQGLVTINYYSAGTPPPAQTTNAPVPGGQTLVFTVSGGGNFGIGPVSNGFAGYIIAQAQFQYCHGYAYISSFGALPTSPGTSEGYLGIILDIPGLNRTGQVGENEAH
jgi:hypothetical protein